MNYWYIGAACALVAGLWLWDIFYSAPMEPFDEDLSKRDQESEALGVVESMRGELDHMQKDGLL